MFEEKLQHACRWGLLACRLLNDAVSNGAYTTLNGSMTEVYGRKRELSRYLSEGTEENTEGLSIVGVPAEILIWHVPTTTAWVNLLSDAGGDAGNYEKLLVEYQIMP
jgi:hypothetical protein